MLFFNGKLIQQYKLDKELHQNSIRHLDISNAGDVAIACQYNGNIQKEVPVLAIINKESEVQFLNLPKRYSKMIKNYCGGVKIHEEANILTASFPRGGILAFWELSSGKFMGFKNNKDVCGIDIDTSLSLFIASNGQGQIFSFDKNNYENIFNKNIQWDNHLKVIRY